MLKLVYISVLHVLTGLAEEPNLDHEKLRRKVENGVREMWFYMRAQLKKVKAMVKDSTNIVSKVNNILEDGRDQNQ